MDDADPRAVAEQGERQFLGLVPGELDVGRASAQA
jgi:hypothetical protein